MSLKNYFIHLIDYLTIFSVPASELWKGVTSVSNAGKKRGRAKGLIRRKDLNRGQIIGLGKANIQWPGLSAPIIRGRELVQRNQLPADPDREAKIIKMRDAMASKKFQKISTLDRGWSGNKMPGRSIGAPDQIGEDSFEGFDTKVIEFKQVFNMKGNLGRKRRLSAFVVTGNKNGLAGFASAKAVDGRAVLRKAKNRAAQKLMHIELCDGHTVFHDYACSFGLTKVFVQKKPEGHGLICHRAIKEICQLVGIKNLYAKVEGAQGVQHIVKAFFLGLLAQKKYDDIAEAKGLNLVEYRPEFGNFPKVVGTPKVCRDQSDIRYDEIMDYNTFAMDGKVVLKKKKFPPFYANTYGYHIHLKKLEGRRNHKKIKFDMLCEHGQIKSYLTDKYPDARPHGYILRDIYLRKKNEEAQQEPEAEVEQ